MSTADFKNQGASEKAIYSFINAHFNIKWLWDALH